mmetsp:Transcript_69563/g.201561  ORF Transcript_69563/g.201561 Transcript_69563/m.201561 type:complete len:424 (-) Transcript_69563:164-1435(-)
MGNAQSGVLGGCCACDPNGESSASPVVVVPLPEVAEILPLPCSPETATSRGGSNSGSTMASPSDALNHPSEFLTENAMTSEGDATMSDKFQGDALVDAALEAASLAMTKQEYNVLSAEAELASTEQRLQAMGDSSRLLERLRSATVYKEVRERVAQLDAATEILYNDHMETLFECEYGQFDICASPDGRWFDYRMTVDIEAPLSEALSTGHEMDFVPQAQPLVNSAQFVGEYSGFSLNSLMRVAVLIFKAELALEIIRNRDHRFGYVLEIVRSEFSHEGLPMPKKAWGAIRPWVYTTNLWLPRGDGKTGCTVVQATRVDCTISVPHWVLNFVFKHMSTSFVEDLRASALKALQPESPWARRIQEDKLGFYKELRKVEEVAHGRREVCSKSIPGREIFERPHRMRPPPVDTRPPSSRHSKHASR